MYDHTPWYNLGSHGLTPLNVNPLSVTTSTCTADIKTVISALDEHIGVSFLSSKRKAWDDLWPGAFPCWKLWDKAWDRTRNYAWMGKCARFKRAAVLNLGWILPGLIGAHLGNWMKLSIRLLKTNCNRNSLRRIWQRKTGLAGVYYVQRITACC